MSLFACVPNVSEARRQDVIDHMSDSISAVRGVKLLDVTSDPQHNRTVFTYVGRQTPVKNATLSLLHSAIEHIDITKHEGKYPRMGIVDVIPIVPLQDSPMEKAIVLANSLAREIAEHFHLPVYMYDYAAKTEERRSLDFIRKGEFEGFKEKIKDETWKPDYGPQIVHPTAGVTSVGARYPLIAMNLLFATDDVETVQTLADKLRQKFKHDNKLKLQLIRPRGYAGLKLAATILDYKTITLCDLVQACKECCELEGIPYDGIELVGLVTGDALFDCLTNVLNLKNFDPHQILDFHIFKK
jgi:glutamate formiminotransferase